MFSARRSIAACSAILLFLAGCAGGGRATTSAGPQRTPPATATPTPLPFLPGDHDPFQATFEESAPLAACPPSSRPTDLCFIVSGTGTSIPYGPITFHSFDVNYLAPGHGPITDYGHNPGFCEPTTRQGSLTIGADTVRFLASGSWCWSLVRFHYQITGGSGAFRQARGQGTISIPDPTNQQLEYWTGTLMA